MKAEWRAMEILKLCVDAGGCLTGEHGVGIEKRDLMLHQFTETDLNQQMRVRAAFDPEMAPQSVQGLPARWQERLPTGQPELRCRRQDSSMSALDIQYPESEEEIARLVVEAGKASRPIEVRGGGTRLDLGRPVQSASVLSVARLSGITNYDPSELVMAARAGTPLAEIEAALAENNQMLTFEPMDHRALLGASGEPTIGGVFAGNVSGPAADFRRCGARQSSGCPLRQWLRRNRQERRPGDEECDRPRSGQADGRFLGHARACSAK
jgi:FAD/FMN-containing dehydrogenase